MTEGLSRDLATEFSSHTLALDQHAAQENAVVFFFLVVSYI